MKIIDGLLGEHALFYRLFDALDEVMDAARTAPEIQSAFDAVRPGILSHAALEDDLLFASVSNGSGGIVSAMRAEHEEIHTLCTAVSRATTVDEARVAGRRLIDLLRDHFHREEEIVFPLLETTLEPSRLEALGDDYKAQRGLS